MKINLYALAFFLLVSTNLFSQTIDKLKISSEELPKEYSFSENPKCKSIQACSLYKQIEIYSSIIGKIKTKDIQNFENTNDSGSIMYFEFEKDFDDEGFVKGLLWGQSNQPTKSHPEEYFTKGNILIVWSFNVKSNLKKISQEKSKTILN